MTPTPRRHLSGLAILAVALLLACSHASLSAPPDAPENADPQPPKEDAPDAPKPAELPHIKVDVANRVVDVEAKVILREAKWLELLACMPGTRDHEAILTTPARPSHIHLALVMIGLEPGAPLAWRREGDNFVAVPPTGDPLRVTLVTRDDNGEHETPANQWVLNQKTNETLQGDTWLFTGSRFEEREGQKVYRADIDGTVISLVNFTDDLIARDTPMTNEDDDSTWGCNTKAIPPVGTQVLIRLRPLPKPKS